MNRLVKVAAGCVLVPLALGMCLGVASEVAKRVPAPPTESVPSALSARVTPLLEAHVPVGASEADRRRVELATAFLAERCPELVRYRADLDSLEANAEDAYGDYRDQFGWERVVWLRVHVAASPTQIPPEYRAGGHVCHFEFGGGTAPGVVVTKRPCMRLCGLTRDEAEVQSARGRPYVIAGASLRELDDPDSVIVSGP